MAAEDRFSHNRSGLDSPAFDGEAITPHDTNEFAKVSRGIYVGVAGDVNLVTKKGTTLYAILLAWPANGRATITSLAAGAKNGPGTVADVSLVGSTSKIIWTRDASGLHVTLPATAPSDYAAALRLTLQ